MRPSPVQMRVPAGYVPGPVPSPAPASRGPGPMIRPPQQPHQQMSQQQMAAQHQAAVAERELAKRRARKPTDKTIPEGVEEIVANARVYRDLREMERRYDAAIMRKRLDIQDAVNRNIKNTRTLRIFVSNTAKDQLWQVSDRPLDENAFDFDTGQIPTFRVKIEGRLLDDEESDAAELDPDSDLGLTPRPDNAPPLQKRKFSHFFKSIVIELDRSRELHPEGNTIEWRKQSPATQPATSALGLNGPAEFDGFEFERKGDDNINCTIKLIRDESPDRFRLSPALADLLDTKEDTRAGIVMKVWEYVRAHGLQDPDEKRTINCNPQLRAIFNVDRLYFPQIPELTLSHIHPLEPIVIKYLVRCDVAASMSPQIHDVTIFIDDPIRQKMHAVMQSPSYIGMLREISTIDDHIAMLVQAINHSKAKRDFWRSLAEDPAEFVKRWVSSQKRDLDTLSGETPGRMVEEDEVRKAAQWKERVAESVYLLLVKQRPVPQ
ncbi:hypothetical protein BZA05DRAFT_330538 [Tricharina praecox]|uniref:uncharacterized protein n=1 Tax=Tricharina praecox TaxID=43433 RepID=UPI002220BF69|nr:uncharacterized protein BZA05DRAFT_330538 [Tricharina praecox]KAI5858667.1 hypothetical protein BZA05DRAFT_330538 [Tricharina praecox]